MFKIISLIIITLFLIPVSSEVKLSENNTSTSNNIYLLYVPKYNKNFNISFNINDLDKNLVCSLEEIDNFNKTILLFGHNNINVFNFLYDLEIDDEIVLYVKDKKLKYYVSSKKIISVSDKSYLDISNNLELRLFTCTLNNNERLVVIAKPNL